MSPGADVEAITAAALAGNGTVHGFFTRAGGVSTGFYDSLNCGPGSGDAADSVAENRRRAAAYLGLAGDALRTCRQVHGTAVVTVTAAPSAASPEADALVTRARGVALGVLTADCAPVLLLDAAAGVAGAAHAGWRGALAGVIEQTVAAMEALGAARGAIAAVVGPCIAQASYEVGPEFPKPFLDRDSGNRRFFAPGARPGHWQFDLAGYATARLAALGLASVTALGLDSHAESGRFFSYRRASHAGEPGYGRCLSVIALS